MKLQPLSDQSNLNKMFVGEKKKEKQKDGNRGKGK